MNGLAYLARLRKLYVLMPYPHELHTAGAHSHTSFSGYKKGVCYAVVGYKLLACTYLRIVTPRFCLAALIFKFHPRISTKMHYCQKNFLDHQLPIDKVPHHEPGPLFFAATSALSVQANPCHFLSIKQSVKVLKYVLWC